MALITSLIDYLFESENQDVYMKVSWGILHNIYKLHKDVIPVLGPEEDFYWGGRQLSASAQCVRQQQVWGHLPAAHKEPFTLPPRSPERSLSEAKWQLPKL